MKYFFFDIDGTLTDIHTGKLVESGIETLRKLEAKGHFVAIATGRAYYKTADIARQAGIRNYVCNGGAGLVINDELVKNAPLDREKILKIIHEADELGYGILIATGDSCDVLMRDERFIEQVGKRREETNYILKPDLKFEDIDDFYKVYISMRKDEERKLRNFDLLGHIRMDTPYFWYQHDHKDKGICDMVEYLKGDIHDVVVFGDGENDVVMFRKEWLCIARGNGDSRLLEKADYVTAASEDDGIHKACLHYGFIDE